MFYGKPWGCCSTRICCCGLRQRNPGDCRRRQHGWSKTPITSSSSALVTTDRIVARYPGPIQRVW